MGLYHMKPAGNQSISKEKQIIFTLSYRRNLVDLRYLETSFDQ